MFDVTLDRSMRQQELMDMARDRAEQWEYITRTPKTPADDVTELNNKEKKMQSGYDCGLRTTEYTCGNTTWTWEYSPNPGEYTTMLTNISNNDKEEKMSLAQQYLHNQKNKNDKSAIKVGAMNDDGTLTREGKELLLNILLTDTKIREQFDKAIELLKEDEEE